MKTGVEIAAKINSIIEEMGVKKTKIGEVLGASKDATNQWKYKKYDLFLSKLRKGKFDIEELQKVANFLGKPVEYFLNLNGNISINNHSDYNKNHVSVHAPTLQSVKKLKEVLKEMGKSDKYIAGLITGLSFHNEK